MNGWCLLIVGGLMFGGTTVNAQTPDTSFSTSTSHLTAPVGDRRITVEASSVSVQTALQQIAEKAGMAVTWTDKVTFPTKKISVSLRDVPLEQALRTVLQDTDTEIRLSSNGKMIVIVPSTSNARERQQAVGVISGRVVDSVTKQGVAGVTVAIPGTKHSVITTATGVFRLHGIPVGEHVVTIKLFGYKAVSRTVNVQKGATVSLQVALASVPTTLSGVVTTVTGVQKKLEIGNDITTIDVEEVLKTAPINSVTDLLETRVPGLTVMRTSGVPGAPSRIRLRGFGGGLLAGQEGAPTNDPIVIVDGIRINASQSAVSDQNIAMEPRLQVADPTYSGSFPTPSAIDQIDPNSIDKIEVFKGPSAAALYGSDAANGVIVITTKRGQAGPARWSLSASQGIEYLSGVYAQPGYYPFCTRPQTPLQDGPPKVCSVSALHNSFIDSVVRFQALNEPRLTSFGTGSGSELSGTVSGGVPTITYSLTASISNDVGLLKVPSLYQDFFKLVYDSAMPNWMRRPNLLQGRSGNASLVMEPHRNMRVTLSTRLSSTTQRQSPAQLQLSELASTYLDTLNLQPAILFDYVTRLDAKRFVVDNTAAVNWDAWQDFPMTFTLGVSRDTRDDTRFLPRGIAGSLSSIDTLGFYSTGTQTTNTGSMRVNGTLFPGRRISVAVGTDMTDQHRRQVSAKADSVSRGVNTPTRFDYAGQISYASATGGWFAEPRLNLNSRFFVNPGFRFDGNSVSGSKSGVGGGLWSLFPKLNFSWIAVDAQEGTPYLGFLSMLRPRLSFGIAGVQPAPGWQLRLMQGTTGESGDRTIEDGGLDVSTLGNTKLRAERTREIEGGFDTDLWNGRVTFTFTQFMKLRTDAIEQLGVAPSVYGGALGQYANIGRVQNSGTEVTLSSTLIENQQVRWAMTASLSKYSNKLVSLNSDDASIDLQNGTRFVPGYPITGRWIRPILGYSTPSAGGRLEKRDVIVGDTAVYVGQQAPNFELPVSTSLSLLRGQVSVNATFQYKDGLTQFNSGSFQLLNNLYLNPKSTLAEQASALASCTNVTDPYCTNYGLVQTVNSLRFSALSIGYNVPRSMSQRLRVSSLSVALQGSNLALWTSYRGKDPDVNGKTVGDATEDNGGLPMPRRWRLQVRIGN